MRVHESSCNAPAAPLSLLDLVSWAADDPCRPLDFTIRLRFRETLNPAALRKGAASACRRFPVTGSCLRRGYWVPLTEGVPFFSAHNAGCEEEACTSVEQFTREPWDLARECPVRQRVLVHANENCTDLITRFHHAAADGISATLWLGHQIGVATGRVPAHLERARFEEIPLQTSPSLRSGRPRKAGGHSEPLWRSGRSSSSIRFWRTICFPSEPMRRGATRDGSFTYNDVLATCALETLRRWNLEHGLDFSKGSSGLWMPMNVRKSPFFGFGNGSSRIRVYGRWNPGSPMVEKCRALRRQIHLCKRSGEWAIPSTRLMSRAPASLLRPMMSFYFRRPWIDVGTAPFSHVERLGNEFDEMLEGIERIEIVGPLHARHPVGIYGATHGGRTWLTFTYDPAQLGAADISRLIALYAEELHRARTALSWRPANAVPLMYSARASYSVRELQPSAIHGAMVSRG